MDVLQQYCRLTQAQLHCVPLSWVLSVNLLKALSPNTEELHRGDKHHSLVFSNDTQWKKRTMITYSALLCAAWTLQNVAS